MRRQWRVRCRRARTATAEPLNAAFATTLFNPGFGLITVTPREIATLQQTLLSMPRQEIVNLYRALDADDPRLEVVEALVRAYRLNLEAA